MRTANSALPTYGRIVNHTGASLVILACVPCGGHAARRRRYARPPCRHLARGVGQPEPRDVRQQA